MGKIIIFFFLQKKKIKNRGKGGGEIGKKKEEAKEVSISPDLRPIVWGGAWMTRKEEEDVSMMMYVLHVHVLYMYLHNTHDVVTYRRGGLEGKGVKGRCRLCSIKSAPPQAVVVDM